MNKNKTSYIPIFDFEFYLKTYSDLLDAKITTRSAAMLHYMTVGKKEGRYCSYDDMVHRYESSNGTRLLDVFDHEFYLKTYTDLSETGIYTRNDAVLHYITNGNVEGRYCSYDDMLVKYEIENGTNIVKNFDHEFYLKTYADLGEMGITSRRDAITHYIQNGHKEHRIYTEENMRNQYKTNLQNAMHELNIFPHEHKIKFRILIRTSNRPEYFKKCIDSILNQNYTHYHIYICYDTNESLEYLKPYENNAKITYFRVRIKSSNKYKFNLYCNILMDMVEDGYIMFLDDDDMMVGPRMLEVLNHEIGTNRIVVWRFLRPDKLIFPTNIDNELILGEIDTASICFHYSLKNTSKWIDKQYGDYYFYKKMFNECIANHKKLLNYTLTGTQFSDRIGNYGN